MSDSSPAGPGYQRLAASLASAERERLHLPHIVIAEDAVSGVITYTGPYPSGLDAATAIERHRRAVGGDTIYGIAPLFPAL